MELLDIARPEDTYSELKRVGREYVLLRLVEQAADTVVCPADRLYMVATFRTSSWGVIERDGHQIVGEEQKGLGEGQGHTPFHSSRGVFGYQ